MLKKPNTKTIIGVTAKVGAFVIGAKVGDGISAVMPDSTNGYKKWAIAGVSIMAAAFINPTTAMAKAGQNALIGMGTKQIYDELSDTLAEAIPVKSADTTSNKFVNAVVGHKEASLNDTTPGLSAAWQGEGSDMWDRPSETMLLGNSFSGV